MKKLIQISILLLIINSVNAQDNDSIFAKKIFASSLTDNSAYENLRYLCKKIGGRVVGSPQSIAAVEFAKQVMQQLKLDTVYLQEAETEYWNRGEMEFGAIVSSKFGVKEVKLSSLGNSVGTGIDGISAEVIEVHSEQELDQLGAKVQGKIVFFNVPMNTTYSQPFRAYGEAVKYRSKGSSMASKYGAVAVIIRSLTMNEDEFPHTGTMRYSDGVKPIPAVALCTKHASLLSEWLKLDSKLIFRLKTDCHVIKNIKTYNIIGELKGQEKPDEIITVGGHIDSWDTGEGANDDGVGSMQSVDVLRLFKKLDYKPKRTIRAVMFMDEENGQVGAKKYADNAKQNNEKLIFALEADEGGATPQGFSFDTDDNKIAKYKAWLKYFKEYDIHRFEKGGSGVDVGFLKGINNVVLSGLQTDPNRYFDTHHSPNDTFENINKREMQLGSAAMATLIYLIDTYGN